MIASSILVPQSEDERTRMLMTLRYDKQYVFSKILSDSPGSHMKESEMFHILSDK